MSGAGLRGRLLLLSLLPPPSCSALPSSLAGALSEPPLLGVQRLGGGLRGLCRQHGALLGWVAPNRKAVRSLQPVVPPSGGCVCGQRVVRGPRASGQGGAPVGEADLSPDGRPLLWWLSWRAPWPWAVVGTGVALRVRSSRCHSTLQAGWWPQQQKAVPTSWSLEPTVRVWAGLAPPLCGLPREPSVGTPVARPATSSDVTPLRRGPRGQAQGGWSGRATVAFVVFSPCKL